MAEQPPAGPDPRSGVDEEGRWTPAFPAQRRPFEVQHGAYATVALGARVEELAAALRELVPTYRPADEVAVRLLALSLARLERSAAAIDGATPAEMERLRQDERGWTNTARRLLGDLGMTPTSRARLKLDVALSARSLTLTGLAQAADAEAVEAAAIDAPADAEAG